MKANNRDVQRISNLAKGYERNLCGKDFLICYGEEGNTRMLEVTFSKKRFNHLVGIDIGAAISSRGCSIRRLLRER